MKTFKQYLLKESVSYTYIVPEYIKKQFFDFYLWSLFYQYPKNYKGFDEETEQDLNIIINDAIEKICNTQKNLLLEAGLYSIKSELVYAYDYNSPQEVKNIIGIDLSPHTILKINKIDQEEYNLVNSFQILFEKAKWGKNYGGKAWADICLGWKQLYNAKDINKKIEAIDHMYDLQHNTGFALNKDSRFSNNWITKALNVKFEGNIWEMVRNSSIPKYIAGYLVKYSGIGPSHEDKYKDLSKISPRILYEKAFEDKKRWIEAEPYIMKDPEYAFYYTANLMKKNRWFEAESYIMKDSEWAYHYAHYIIGNRWKEAEPYIMKNMKWTWYYINDVLKRKRWPEAEPIIMKQPQWAYLYASDIMQERWIEAEPYIQQDNSAWIRYKEKFKI